MSDEDTVEIPIVFVGTEDVPVVLANQFVVQHQRNEFILTLGQVTPPILLGSDEERFEQAKKVAYIPVKVVARVSFTRDRLVELIGALKKHLEKYDSVSGEER